MPTPIIRSAFSLLSPGGPRARLSILLFHRVLDRPDPLFPDEIDRVRFSKICSSLKRWCNVLPLSSAIEKLKNGSLPARAACITFDDGYADNYLNALPILKSHSLHATFFVASGFLDGGRMWNDTIIEAVRTARNSDIDLEAAGIGHLRIDSVEAKRDALTVLIPAVKHLEPAMRDETVAQIRLLTNPEKLPDNLMLSTDQLREMHTEGMGIGAHTVNHPILASCDLTVARKEIDDGRTQLEDIIGEPIRLFAYPNGKRDLDYAEEHVRLARELNFDAAVTTNPGASRQGDDYFQVSRFTPWDRQMWRFGVRLAHNLTHSPGV